MRLCRAMLRILTILVLLFLSGLPFAQQLQSNIGNVSPAQANPVIRILIITSPGEYGFEMAKLLEDLFGFDVEVTDTDRYAPLIDEYVYDGFVYMAGKYNIPPKASLLEDMRKTNKPLLWINYHAWLLGSDFFHKKGFDVRDDYGKQYSHLLADVVSNLSPTDTTVIKAKGDKILYWLFNPNKGLEPAAAHSENFTYLGYSPTIDTSKADFRAFRSALNKAFGNISPSGYKSLSNYKQRLSSIRKDDFRTGIHLPVYVAGSTDVTHAYDSDYWHSNLIRIKETGAEWVSIVSVYYQEYVDSSRIYADPERTPRADVLRAIIDDAHKLGLHVRLYFVVNIAKPKKAEWRGFILPKNREHWWRSYQKFALLLAKLAKEKEVESFVLGAELNKMQRDAKGWQNLVSLVRNRVKYEGLLGYQVNYDALELMWAKSLDFVGIAAYWPLAGNRDPKLVELRESWSVIKNKLDTWIHQHPGVALEFSEIGYVSQPHTSEFPYTWKPFRGREQSTSEQLQCYQALYDFLFDYKAIKGVHIFASTEEDEVSGGRGYTPFGKPAQGVLEKIIDIR